MVKPNHAIALFQLVIVVLSLGSLASGSQKSEVIRQRAREVFSRGHYQDSLMLGTKDDRNMKANEGKDPSWKRDEPTVRYPEPEREVAIPSSPSSAGGTLRSVATLILYLFMGVLLVLVVIWLVSILRQRSPGKDAVGGPVASQRKILQAEGQVLPVRSKGEPGDGLTLTDKLASSGKLEEAVHQLLLHTIQQLSQKFSPRKDSLTSRELVDVFPLDEKRKQVLRDLVMTVEGSLFGSNSVDRTTYDACREGIEVVLPGDHG